MPSPEYLVVISRADPVAEAVRSLLPVGDPTGRSVEGSPVRALGDRALYLERPGPAIHDEHLEQRLRSAGIAAPLPIVFASIHRSEQGVPCFTVHPLGNPGEARLGGEAGTLVPTDPRRMADALRRLDEEGRRIGWRATYEATHHGPALDWPAFFVEIGYGESPSPPTEAVRALARVLPELTEEPRDRVAVGLGGGHYAPHFSDLTRRRYWAFGHILSKHSLEVAPPERIGEAMRKSPGAEGYLYHRAADAREGPAADRSPRLAESSAPRREVPPTSASRANGRGAGT